MSRSLSYKTQSIDTSIEAELVQFSLWRSRLPSQRLILASDMTRRCWELSMDGMRNRYPDATVWQIKELFIKATIGEEWVRILKDILGENFVLRDPVWLVIKLADILNSLSIPYYVGGSVASSTHGEPRATQDVDIIVDIKTQEVEPLIQALSGEFYISEIAVNDAINGKVSSFNVIHLESVAKADIFVMKNEPFALSKMERRQIHIPFNNPEKAFYICTPEDTILQKLVWHRMAFGDSPRQWRDILGVLKLQGDTLDFDYLWEWAETLHLESDLDRAFSEADLIGF
ncbi:MAG TPA: hypothetical protein DEG17_15225 [Cyanobacteria bacterium UBA11149]|nr:hypothetical protein [Cyanobacteria bacterium UBA11367]HBE55950.1 hypothetical protein [Cyanobacteria bacterium UBA11366]HBK63755.1 hypothetical protein [Cyanobacteria bacterium UBA11166]HBR72792.1 hypothetical protein [Cyanobacteria bacterium UBA11159]HBS68642.1 hypothetical protein [Cyanobacteria bacterium UBA11153]HBW90185.1 hypothetical protein [Cyanobacteria bacterium UBA11149]HCA93642.1 hypothetical protein [Cyanobacteria bacterium UBA9226]